MLSHKILTRQDINKVVHYYADSADDYYAKDGNASGWQGKGATTLKLKGSVEAEIFRKLLSGNTDLTGSHNSTKSRSSTRKDSNDRIGIDFTFSAPKSLSMQALIGLDKNIIKAHDKAVKNALICAEKLAEARKKIKGKSYAEKTKNLIVAKFRHETSRERDPQLHTHAVIMNLTQRSDKKWVALRNDEIIKMTRYLGAVYRSELALSLQKMGYILRTEEKGFFELAHIDRKQIDGFSLRSGQIEDLLAKQGLTRASASTEQKQRATLQSRNPKTATEREEILKDWQARTQELGVNFDHLSYIKEAKPESKLALQSLNIASDKILKAEAAKRAVRFAVNHLTEREAVIKHSKLLDVAVKHSVGLVDLTSIKKEVMRLTKAGSLIQKDALYSPSGSKGAGDGKKREQTEKAWLAELAEKDMNKGSARKYFKDAIKDGRLIKSEASYTTASALKKEKKILQIEFEGRKSLPSIMAEALAKEKLECTNLNKGQREAALLMTSTTNLVVGIQGFAGTGKSHMLKTAKKMIEESGYRVQALAPYGSQVKALKLLGIESRTLASFLHSKDKNIDSKSIVVIDESGVVPTRQMEQTLRLIEKAGGRAVLIGDTAQTKAIEAGRPFEQLQNEGMSTAYMNKIERQKNKELKEAVEFAAKGDTTPSLSVLERIGSIFETKDEAERLKNIAADYIALSPAERDKTIIVSGTNEARRYINNEVRKRLKLEGQLGEKGEKIKKKARVFETLRNNDSTGAERKHAKSYRIGDLISPEKDYSKIGLKQDELYKVEDNSSGNNGNKLKVMSKDGKQIEFSPAVYNKLRIYQPESLELAVGDSVRITRSDSKLNLVNGDRFKVREVQKEHVILTRVDEDGNKDKGKNKKDKKKNQDIKLMTNKPLHIDYAYATTVHSSQGLTSDRALIDINTKSLTTMKDIYYVAISRAKIEARIYTNNIKELPKAISRERIKSAALDMVKVGYERAYAR